MLQEYEKSLLGDPLKDRATYHVASPSPITYIHNVKAPLPVLQGDNDPRVPKEEAQQVVELLKKDGKTVDAHYYANEGRGFAKRENQIDSIRRSVEWFDKYLKGAIDLRRRCSVAAAGVVVNRKTSGSPRPPIRRSERNVVLQ
jgi:dipeptidyl aminopeptidase/acylaminoacyl peptidase